MYWKLVNFGYNRGDCPLSEQAGERMLNLPTSLDSKDSEIFISLMKNILTKQINTP